MAADLPAELREAAGRAAHTAYRVGYAVWAHTPAACPSQDGSGARRCPRCDALVRAWPDLTEAQREAFRASQDPALSVLAPLLARADRYAAALAHVESLGFHINGCYAHVEDTPDDDEPRCAPECPTATAKRAREET